MPIAVTTESKLQAIELFMRMMLRTPTSTVSGILAPTGTDYPILIRIPALTDTTTGLQFRPWMGATPDTADMAVELVVVTPREGSSANADVGIAIIHVDQVNAAGHPVNLCIKSHFGDEGGDWFGNVIMLKYDLQHDGIRPLTREHVVLASQCLEQYVYVDVQATPPK
ncbi:hypothetical protein R3P38DRAFT_3191236 [Favolaschia claudopus]|uniref:Uncharacterized protein n=1 Tax=Favolaschia claudopus TaxID=2862362 RepID=A0AAW0BLM7_9AGAR